ncbi:hypothetical protein PAXRUDRAFT_17818 [Paxillus rubicundulus Ve08.2h10]|uniref:Uncharacterized protein n=1 Tax=Paxillus rubicundulus Ve08.2h10 TaxID=930991 RepID=A0A0D0DGF5_9AGAM|nr:hypothetical protein PAXRUDRAFT_17818 [Paxillus rubicundulus Ve08.2h10]
MNISIVIQTILDTAMDILDQGTPVLYACSAAQQLIPGLFPLHHSHACPSTLVDTQGTTYETVL